MTPSDPHVSQEAAIFAWVTTGVTKFCATVLAMPLLEGVQIFAFCMASIVSIGALWINWDRYVAAFKRRFKDEEE